MKNRVEKGEEQKRLTIDSLYISDDSKKAKSDDRSYQNSDSDDRQDYPHSYVEQPETADAFNLDSERQPRSFGRGDHSGASGTGEQRVQGISDTPLELRGEIVVPGEKLGEGLKRFGDFTFSEDNIVRSSVLGIKEEKKGHISVIPLFGKYMPKEGDMVVGLVTDVGHNYWKLNINAPYEATLNFEEDRCGGRAGLRGREEQQEELDLRKIYKEGDLLSVKIIGVNEIKDSYVAGPRKLTGGRIVLVSAKKVPRIIGNQKSMLNLLRDKTGCRIVVGQNGIIWLDGDEKAMELAVETILKIENESHTKGLTDRIGVFLEEGMRRLNIKPQPPAHRSAYKD